MTRLFPVRALAVGYYGGQMRQPDEKFNISGPGALGSWMEPIGWNPSDKAPKLSKVGQAELDELAAAEIAAQTAKKAEQDPKAFRGAKEVYGEGEVTATLVEALTKAVSDFGHGVEKWNDLSEKDRKDAILGVVRELMKKRQAEHAAKLDAGEGGSA